MPKRSRSGVGQQPGARGRADQRERRQVERDDLRPRPDAERDRQLAVLHRRVEGLLDRARQPVDLVDEEHRAGLRRGQERRDLGLALQRRAGGLADRDAELVGDDPRQRVLPRPGGPANSTWSSASPRVQRGPDRELELGLQRLLADELVQPPRAQPRLLLVAVAHLRRLDPFDVGARGADHLRATFRAWAIRASGVSPGASASSPSTSCGEKPRPSRPSRASACGSSVRVMTIGSSTAPGRPSRAARRRSARRCACRCRGRPAGARCRRRRRRPAARAAGRREHGERHLRADGLHAEQQQEQVALLLGGEAVQQQRVVADDQVAEQSRGFAYTRARA